MVKTITQQTNNTLILGLSALIRVDTKQLRKVSKKGPGTPKNAYLKYFHPVLGHT
jgi:hypothetical protein